MTSISVVIPTYKRSALTLKLVKQIKKFNPEIEIIVVNQQGNLKEKLAFEKQQITYINLEQANTATAKNVGWRNSRGEVIIFFDDDVEITPKTIKAHQKAYHNKNIFGVGGRVINDGEIIPKQNQVKTGETNNLFSKFLFRFWSTKSQNIEFVYGCNMSFRKEILKQIGGFDERFKLAFEEIDLSIRVKQIGGIIKFVPDALVYHHKWKSGGTRFNKKIDKKQINYFYYGLFVKKHLKGWKFWLLALLRSGTIVIKEKNPKLLKWWWRGLWNKNKL